MCICIIMRWSCFHLHVVMELGDANCVCVCVCVCVCTQRVKCGTGTIHNCGDTLEANFIASYCLVHSQLLYLNSLSLSLTSCYFVRLHSDRVGFVYCDSRSNSEQ
jgi:hypothetical protein